MKHPLPILLAAAWADTLQPPGIRPVATDYDRRHAELFTTHKIIDQVAAPEKARP